MFRLLGKKIITILRSKILLNWTYDDLCGMLYPGLIGTENHKYREPHAQISAHIEYLQQDYILSYAD